MRYLIPTLMLIWSACGPATEEQGVTDPAERPVALPGPVIAPDGAPFRITAAPEASQFPEASLRLADLELTDDMEADFTMTVDGFELGSSTPDAAVRGCANSEDGQHIHVILNNKPYLAKYEPTFSAPVDPGRNVLLAFLSRSYHESLKQGSSFVVKEFDVPSDSASSTSILDGQHMFYSRPKGDYTNSSGDKVLLDFFLVGTSLAADANRVRATIDGHSFILTEWRAYFIEGLEVGEHTVRLELIDRDGALVPGPFNDSGIRTFKLLEG
ncbi:MAG: hypothetical protein KDB88_04970 [Flavobacteriales bacterium]|nr:hypothetical protein [Flavobacteriales bacterium]